MLLGHPDSRSQLEGHTGARGLEPGRRTAPTRVGAPRRLLRALTVSLLPPPYPRPVDGRASVRQCHLVSVYTAHVLPIATHTGGLACIS